MNLKNILLGCTLAFMTYTAQAQTQIITGTDTDNSSSRILENREFCPKLNYRTEESCRSQSLRLGI